MIKQKGKFVCNNMNLVSTETIIYPILSHPGGGMRDFQQKKVLSSPPIYKCECIQRNKHMRMIFLISVLCVLVTHKNSAIQGILEAGQEVALKRLSS